jgi:DNA repair exonuclease SbcCD nuclease subunit
MLRRMRFIHTADWQIGKPFRNFGEKEPVLRQARLAAIESIGRLAVREAAPVVLVAGDLYDSEQPSHRTLLEPLERMRTFAGVSWHILPGNHDPHRDRGLWHRLMADGLPGNIHLHLEPKPAELGPGAVLLPAPLRRKSEANDLTDWMDRAESAPGLIRLGLAHGSIAGFEPGGEASNPVAPDRARRAGLDYLALGDWHRTMRVDDRTWYSGTPEADRFDSQTAGQVLLIDIAGPGAPPGVRPVRTGAYRWETLAGEVLQESDAADLETRIRALPDLPNLLLKLRLKGALDLSARAAFSPRLAALEAALFWLDADLADVRVRPSLGDLERIDFGGVLREAAEMLKEQAEDPALAAVDRKRAGDALVQLFLLLRRDGAGEPA